MLALIIVGAIAACAAIDTLKTLKPQTKASMIAARASLQQANYLTKSERAWITVSSRFPQGLRPGDPYTITRIRWDVKNVGKSPASFLEFNVVGCRAKRSIPFPDPPRFLGSLHWRSITNWTTLPKMNLPKSRSAPVQKATYPTGTGRSLLDSLTSANDKT